MDLERLEALAQGLAWDGEKIPTEQQYEGMKSLVKRLEDSEKDALEVCRDLQGKSGGLFSEWKQFVDLMETRFGEVVEWEKEPDEARMARRYVRTMTFLNETPYLTSDESYHSVFDEWRDSFEFRAWRRLREHGFQEIARKVRAVSLWGNLKAQEEAMKEALEAVGVIKPEPGPSAMPKELPKMFERKEIQKILDATDEVERDGDLFRWNGEQWAFVLYATLICDMFKLYYKGGYRWQDFADAFQEDRNKIDSWKSTAITLRDEGDPKKTAKKKDFRRTINLYKPRP